jgi:hypothetical protein
MCIFIFIAKKSQKLVEDVKYKAFEYLNLKWRHYYRNGAPLNVLW